MSNDSNSNDSADNADLISKSIAAPVFLDFLTSKGLDNLKCELCGGGDWMVTTTNVFKVDTIAQTVVGVDQEHGVIATKRPFVFIFCADCGNTKQMYADLVKARLNPDLPESKALLSVISESIAQGKQGRDA
ncbi:TPA: hypothetical protein ACOJPK_001606 [Pseudomonas putida]